MKLRIFLIALLLSIFFVVSTAFALTEQERETMVMQIKTQIAQLTQQLNQMKAEQQKAAANWCHDFNNNLGYANSGSAEIADLHIALQKEGISYSPDGSDTYSKGTSLAVVAFQRKYGINPQSGYVGFATRKKLNQLYGCNVSTPAPNTSCTPNWQYGSWSVCVDSQQTRTATDSNNCGVTPVVSMLIRACSSPDTNQNGVVCAQDVRQCSGGTYVSRVPPSCNFAACPASNSSANNTNAAVCSPSWQCGGWSACQNSQQSRTCTDSRNCGAETNKPALTQSCCSPNWQCSGWSVCSDSQHVRICTDLNSCGVASDRPSELEPCVMPPKVSLTAYWGNGPLNFLRGSIIIPDNTSIVLNWKSEYVDSCSVSSNWPGQVSTAGSQATPKLTSTQTYTITCAGPGGTASDSLVVNTTSNFVVDLKADDSDGPITVSNKGSANLTWNSLNVSSCKIAPITYCVGCNPDYEIVGAFETVTNYGFKTTGSLVYGAHAPKKSYVLNCINSAGQAISDTVVMNISQQTTVPTVSLLANGKAGIVTIYDTHAVNLAWEASGANTCIASGEWSGAKPVSGSEIVKALSNSIYSLACAGPTGTSSASVSVKKQTQHSSVIGAGSGSGTGTNTGTGTSSNSTGNTGSSTPSTDVAYELYSVGGGNVQCGGSGATANSCPIGYSCISGSLIWPGTSTLGSFCAREKRDRSATGKRCSANTDCPTGYICSCNYYSSGTGPACGVAPYYYSKTCTQGYLDY